MGSKKIRKPQSRKQKILSIAGTFAAIGGLLIMGFTEPEQLEGFTFLHILNIILLLAAIICALGLWYVSVKAGKEDREEAATAEADSKGKYFADNIDINNKNIEKENRSQ